MSAVVLVAAPGDRDEPRIEVPLRVDGTVLRDATGARVGLKGLAVQMVPYYAAADGGRDAFLSRVTTRNFARRDAEFAALRRLGYNATRVHLPGPAVFGAERYESRSASVERVRAVVSSARAHGLVTILDVDATGDDLIDWESFKPVLSALVAALGDDPWVVWEPFNEPADYAPGAPRYLEAVKGVGVFLRSLGVSQPIILPANEYEQRVSPAAMDDVLADADRRGWRGAGLLFGIHPYLDHYVGRPGGRRDAFFGTPAFADLDAAIAAHVSAYPLIVTEMGRFNNGVTTTGATREAYAWIAGLGPAGLNGLIGWSWDWGLGPGASDPNAWSFDGLRLNAWGRQAHEASLAGMRFGGPAEPPVTTSRSR